MLFLPFASLVLLHCHRNIMHVAIDVNIMFKNSNGMTKEHSLIVVQLSSWLLPLPPLPALPSLTAKCISKYTIIGMGTRAGIYIN